MCCLEADHIPPPWMGYQTAFLPVTTPFYLSILVCSDCSHSPSLVLLCFGMKMIWDSYMCPRHVGKAQEGSTLSWAIGTVICVKVLGLRLLRGISAALPSFWGLQDTSVPLYSGCKRLPRFLPCEFFFSVKASTLIFPSLTFMTCIKLRTLGITLSLTSLSKRIISSQTFVLITSLSVLFQYSNIQSSEIKIWNLLKGHNLTYCKMMISLYLFEARDSLLNTKLLNDTGMFCCRIT